MVFDAILAALCVAAASLVGALFFGNNQRLIGLERYVVPAAVGVFLSLVLFELIPETLLTEPKWGGLAVAFGFIAFYVLAQWLHNHFHRLGDVDCDRKSAASLLLIGDSIHNLADGVILGGAFLIDPAVGFATAIGLALHEIPQEIVEFGVLVRGGYTRAQAALRNFLSASSIVVGTVAVILVAEHAQEYVWLITGIAAGNLLFLAASDLLPRIHGNLKNYGSIWNATAAIVIGFLFMTVVLEWTHSTFGHGHAHDESGHHDDHADEHTHEDEHHAADDHHHDDADHTH